VIFAIAQLSCYSKRFSFVIRRYYFMIAANVTTILTQCNDEN